MPALQGRLAQGCSKTYNPGMRKIQRLLPLLAILLASTALRAAADAPQPADQALAVAEAAAAAQHKNVWVIFGASWCGWCHKLDALIHSSDVGPVLDQYFIVTHVTVDEHGDKVNLDSPGGNELRKRLGASNSTSLPFFAFVDPAGNVLVNSNRDGKPGANIGFPSAPEEVDWFMVMLQRAAPSLSTDQARMIEARLRSKS